MATEIIGHRGAAGHAPENTLASMRLAAELGARWVEFDVKLSRDGVLLLVHDDDLDRTTDGHGPVAGKDWAELSRLDAGGWFSDRFAGEPIPTLDQTAALLADLALGAHLEIKPCPGREDETGAAVGRYLARNWTQGSPAPVVSSFSAEALAACRNVVPHLDHAWLVEEPPAGWSATLDRLGASALHVEDPWATPELRAMLTGQGRALRVYTVNDPARGVELRDLGVDGIFSDYPDRLHRVLDMALKAN